VPVDLARALRHVLRRAGVLVEAAHVDLPHVVAGLPLHDPFRSVPSRATAEDDAEDAEAGEHVEVGEARHRSHQAAPVRRIAVGPVHDRLDPRTRERRHPSRHAREHVLEPIQVGREKTAVEVLRNPIQRPRPGVAFEGSDEERAALPSNVERGVRIPEHGQLRLERSHLVDDLGDQVVVLEGHDREIHPDQLTDLSRPLARGVDHDLCADLALRGL
jgi:hypothetical protein